MPRPKKYPDELMDRGVRLVLESKRPIAHVAADLGVGAEALRKRVRRAQADAGTASRVVELARSVRRSASCGARCPSCAARTRSCNRLLCFLRRSSTRTERGERVCRSASRPLRGRADLCDLGRVGVRVLPARDGRALSARGRGRAAAGGDPSRRTRRTTFAYGYRRMWKALRARRRAASALPGARLMAANGIQGAKRRGKPWRTTTLIPRRCGRLISSSGTSPRRARTACGWPISRICGAGRASRSSAS